MSKLGPTTFETKRKRRKEKHKQRIERFHRHHEKLEMRRALMATHEQLGNVEEAKRLAVQIHNLKQQIRYMGMTDEEIRNDEG